MRLGWPAVYAAAAASVVALAAPSPAPPATFDVPRLTVPAQLRVVSYYPSDAGWTQMWTNWRPERLGADFGRIAALGANTVRAVVQASLFGYPLVDPVYLARLRQFVDVAWQNGLYVQLTLFDWWSEYGDLDGSQLWAQQLLAPFVGDPRLAFVEIRNELAVSAASAAWARTMIPFVRSLMLGRTPVTVSVTGADPLRPLANLKRVLGDVRPDFFDIHFYGGAGERAFATFARAKELVSPTPLWVGETGYPSSETVSGFGGVALTPSAQEAAQAHFLATVGWAVRANGLAPPGIWALDDFLPEALPVWSGQNREAELHFGVFRLDGSAKPAAATVRAAFAGSPPLSFNNGFEQSVDGGGDVDVPAVWSRSDTPVAVASDRAIFRSGQASARLSALAGTPLRGSLSVAPVACAVLRGDRVELAVSNRRSERSVLAFAVLAWFDRLGSRIGQARSLRGDMAPGLWTRLRVRAVAPARATYVRIELVARGPKGSVWFDDVTFRVLALKE